MYMCIHALVELSRYCLDVDVCGSVRRCMRCYYNIYIVFVYTMSCIIMYYERKKYGKLIRTSKAKQ